MATELVVGQGKYTYSVDKNWGRGTGALTAFGVAQGVTGDSKDRIYVFQRSPTAEILILDRAGNFISRWGDGSFGLPHGIWTNDRDELFITDTKLHTITHWTNDGKLLRTWGTPGVPGAQDVPFNRPTKAFVAADGEMYVSDGYGHQRVHRYDRSGDVIHSWGSKGTGPGQFALPHDVWIDERNRVLICDRENRRVQIFDRAGNFVSEWANVQNPMQIYIRDNLIYMAHAYAEISIRTLDGEVLAKWPYESNVPVANERSPHSIWVDSQGDIYVAEVTGENGFQKFSRR
jgi:sugar lactone lactonase YvrE